MVLFRPRCRVVVALMFAFSMVLGVAPEAKSRELAIHDQQIVYPLQEGLLFYEGDEPASVGVLLRGKRNASDWSSYADYSKKNNWHRDHWAIVSLNNTSGGLLNLALENAYASSYRVTVYVAYQGKVLGQYGLGNADTAVPHTGFYRYRHVDLTLPAEQSRTLLIQFTGPIAQIVPSLSVRSAYPFEALGLQGIYLDWLYYGTSLLLALFGLVALVATKQQFYLHFSIFTSLTMLGDWYRMGYGQSFITPDWAVWNERAYIIVPMLVFASLCRFTIYYHDLKNRQPAWAMLSGVVEALLLLSALVFVFLPFETLLYVIYPPFIVGMLYLLAIWFRSAQMWRQGDPIARNFFLAWGLYFLAAGAFLYLSFIDSYYLGWPSILLKFGYITVACALLFTQLSQYHSLQIERERIVAEGDAKSEFLARMSHEIRTPMNGVLGMAELLRQTQLNESQRHYADIIHNSGQALLGIINDVLDFSKISAGKLKIESVDVNVSALVREAADLFRASAQEKKVDLVCRIAPDVPRVITGDPVRVRQVLINLLSNAFKFTDNGEVFVNVECVPENQIKFSVKDTGIGIPEDKLSTLFDSFSQVDSSTSRRYGGSGLGLAICKQIAELMGGAISVNSTAHIGTEFSMSIPLVQRLSAPMGVVNESAAALAGRKVLLVDDNDTYLNVVAELSTGWGFTLDLLNSGPAAMDAITKAEASGAPYDLISIDIDMSATSGVELAKRIREDFPQSSYPVLLLSLTAQLPQPEEYQPWGVSYAALKPVMSTDLPRVFVESLHCGESREQARQKVTDTTSLKILVAEDNEVNFKVAEGLLKSIGHRVERAINGLDALEKVKVSLVSPFTENYDVILMDCEMPVMDGLESTRKIRLLEKMSQLPTLPIIALTAHAIKEHLDQCVVAGMDDYLTKPINSRELEKKLSGYC